MTRKERKAMAMVKRFEILTDLLEVMAQNTESGGKNMLEALQDYARRRIKSNPQEAQLVREAVCELRRRFRQAADRVAQRPSMPYESGRFNGVKENTSNSPKA